MANLKLVPSQIIEESVDAHSSAIVFNPTDGLSPIEEQQKDTFFLAPESQSSAELSAGAELLIFKKRI